MKIQIEIGGSLIIGQPGPGATGLLLAETDLTAISVNSYRDGQSEKRVVVIVARSNAVQQTPELKRLIPRLLHETAHELSDVSSAGSTLLRYGRFSRSSIAERGAFHSAGRWGYRRATALPAVRQSNN